MEIYAIPELRNPIMLYAFSGWSDAGEASTGFLNHLLKNLSSERASSFTSESFPLIAQIDSDEYYDFQVNRPTISLDSLSVRSIKWPGVEIFGLRNLKGDRDFIVVRGIEPSMKWQAFADEILDFAEDCEVSLAISIGSMLADVAHTRPIPVSATGSHPSIAQRMGIEVSAYEGPTGIMAIIQDACVKRDIDSLALWAALPHYAQATSSPKATLALLNGLEDLLELTFPLGTLPEDSNAWEASLTQAVSEDSDLKEYVEGLEESHDTSDDDQSGDAIAREVERFLRRESSKERDSDG
jgi:predicted ATP-grasp superfamily ATP-dependent carboligase